MTSPGHWFCASVEFERSWPKLWATASAPTAVVFPVLFDASL